MQIIIIKKQRNKARASGQIKSRKSNKIKIIKKVSNYNYLKNFQNMRIKLLNIINNLY